MFEQLDFVYLPSRDVAADVKHFTDGLGGELVFAIEAFETRVAMVRLDADGPSVLLAGHLDGDQPVLVYRVADLEPAVVARSRCGLGSRFLSGRGRSSYARGRSGSRCTRSRARAPASGSRGAEIFDGAHCPS